MPNIKNKVKKKKKRQLKYVNKNKRKSCKISWCGSLQKRVKY